MSLVVPNEVAYALAARHIPTLYQIESLFSLLGSEGIARDVAEKYKLCFRKGMEVALSNTQIADGQLIFNVPGLYTTQETKMSVFDNMRTELNELVRLVRESTSYCTAVAAKPELATEESHSKEIQREQRIAVLSQQYGITT